MEMKLQFINSRNDGCFVNIEFREDGQLNVVLVSQSHATVDTVTIQAEELYRQLSTWQNW